MLDKHSDQIPIQCSSLPEPNRMKVRPLGGAIGGERNIQGLLEGPQTQLGNSCFQRNSGGSQDSVLPSSLGASKRKRQKEEPAWTEEPGGLQSMGLHRVRHD